MNFRLKMLETVKSPSEKNEIKQLWKPISDVCPAIPFDSMVLWTAAAVACVFYAHLTW